MTENVSLTLIFRGGDSGVSGQDANAGKIVLGGFVAAETAK